MGVEEKDDTEASYKSTKSSHYKESTCNRSNKNVPHDECSPVNNITTGQFYNSNKPTSETLYFYYYIF